MTYLYLLACGFLHVEVEMAIGIAVHSYQVPLGTNTVTVSTNRSLMATMAGCHCYFYSHAPTIGFSLLFDFVGNDW